MEQIDLRSDTLTRPTPEMLEAMMHAKVGDDVFGEDPTINELQDYCARLFNKESALFCPSGTMSNQIAMKVHTQPGDEVICHKFSHIYKYEGGGIAANSGASVRLLDGEGGLFTVEDVKANVNPDDQHLPRTRLVELENTCNQGGGICWDLSEMEKITTFASNNNIRTHLDGARIFNAITATNTKPQDYGRLFDTISICLSKGLGAPIGSVLLGSKKDIAKGHRIRKRLGGGMRQAGYLAAAGLYALKNNISRIQEDHSRAKLLAKTLLGLPMVEKILPGNTNIVIFRLIPEWDNQRFLKKLEEHNILAIDMGKQLIRFVTHLNFTEQQLEKTVQILNAL